MSCHHISLKQKALKAKMTFDEFLHAVRGEYVRKADAMVDEVYDRAQRADLFAYGLPAAAEIAEGLQSLRARVPLKRHDNP